MKRAVLSSLLTLSLGLTGGAIASVVPGGIGMAGATLLAPAKNEPAIARDFPISPAAGDGIADLVDQVKAAVVNIDTVAHQRARPQTQAELFRQYFGDGQAPGPQERKGVGSGFVVRSEGLIVTNYHVVRGADKLTVTFADGRKLPGKVVGHDAGTDLALVRVEAKGLTALKLAAPESLRVGQYVVAVGSPLGLSQTVTAGILSAINRDIELNARVGFLQTDAPINPGNSGGPLLNLRGEVIGVNTAVAARGQGIGFAVPVDTLKQVLPQLEAKGRVDRAWLGVGVANLPENRAEMFYPVDHGVLVGRVEAKSPAGHAGLRQGDVLLSLDGRKLENAAQLIREVNKLPVGREVSLLVNRQGQERTLKLKLERMPEKLSAGE